MYNHIRGRLVEKNPAYVVIEANGIGYQVNISLNTYTRLADSEAVLLFSYAPCCAKMPGSFLALPMSMNASHLNCSSAFRALAQIQPALFFHRLPLPKWKPQF